MATLLLPPGRTHEERPTTASATLVYVLSPIRGADGHLRLVHEAIPAGGFLAEVLPQTERWAQITCNGAVIPPEQQSTLAVASDDEIWLWPAWGDPIFTPAILGYLIPIAIGLVVSIGLTALNYVLFPPSKPHIATSVDEHTFSFEGIRTAIGPGQPVPIIYGNHRVGGQLLRAYVDQTMTVLDTGFGVTQVTALSTPPTLNMLIALGEGPIAAILEATMELNGQPIANFPLTQVTTRLGTPDQPPIPEFVEIRNSFADGRELGFEASNPITYTTHTAVTGFILTIVWNQGLFNVSPKGDKEDNMVNVAYHIAFHGTNAYTNWTTVQVSAQRTAPVRIAIRAETANAVYDIQLNYGGVRHNDDLHGKWIPTLESVTEIQPGTESFPNTALLGIRAVATDALQGALPNITVIVSGRTVRVGTFNPAESWTDNPAWCIMDFLTHPRYGLGVPDSTIDLGSFAAWSAYCDEIIDGELRHRFNYVLDRDARAQALLLEMMGGSRTMLLKSEGLWTARPTRNDPPVQLISWTSCTNVRVTYTRDADRINVMEARFANEEQAYAQDVLTWPTIANWPADVRKASLEIRGVTKPSRIMRALQFELNRRRFENVQLEMDCSLDAIVLQVHDLFRFSHPMPGWGVSGRVQEGSTSTMLLLDEDVTMDGGQSYQVYVKFNTDYTEVRPVINTGETTRVLALAIPLSGDPQPRVDVWAFGRSSPDTAVKVFRVVKITRRSDTTVHVEAIIHNPSITDEPEATALPVTTGLFNPLGPPPPLTALLATELTRVQLNGASMRVVNLSWDVAPLGPGFAPYAGASIFRRTVLDSSSAGMVTAGQATFGATQQDANFNFMSMDSVRGHILDWDDYSVVTGGTYVYRVVPVSQRGVPNEGGSLEVLIHVAGATTPDFFPGSPLNLRLKGQPVGATEWEGRDVHLVWDAPQSALFNDTFFLQDYLVQVWAPGQLYLMRATATTATEFTYTYEQNTEDNIHAGYLGARRDLMFVVTARTNTGRSSLDPASITVTNPPPDMSNIRPDTIAGMLMATISWDQYVEPRDFDHYELHLDVINPPVAIYIDVVALGFHGPHTNFRKVFPQNLTAGQVYYIFVLPYDSFGAGIASQVATVTPFGLDPTLIDTTPPGPPTNLLLTQGRDVSDDGTIVPWVEAHWTPPPDEDVAAYQVHVFVGADVINPTVYSPEVQQTTIRFAVPGGVTIRVKVLAVDRFGNAGLFTAEGSILTDGDTVPPTPPTNLTTVSSIRAIALFWTPPPDADYAYTQVWSATANDRTSAVLVGTGIHSFVHEGLGPNDTRYYWARAVDTSGNISVHFFPDASTGGIAGTAGQLDTTYISSLAADKIIAGTIMAFVSLGVANRIFLDGVNDVITIQDFDGRTRVQLGKFGALSTQWGLRIFDQAGALQWNFDTGLLAPGITDGAITARAIQTGVIEARHLVTDTAVITQTAQIANGVITDAHITNLAVENVLAGTMNVLWRIGLGSTGRLQLDGPAESLLVYDDNNTVRIRIGHLQPGPFNYGMYMWNSAGQLMLDFDTGATEFGIQNLAISSAKIQNAAIMNAHIHDLEVDNAKIANLTVGTGKIAPNAVSASILFAGSGGGGSDSFDIEYARVTMNLNTGDQVLLIGTCTILGAGQAGSGSLFLREDSTTGTLHHQADALQTGADASSRQSLTVEGVFVSPGELAGKVFMLTGRGVVSFANVRFVAFQLHK